MNSQITSKLEVNLLDAKISPQYISEFVIKYRIPTIVAAPEYVAPLVAHRAIMGGTYRIVCALDFPKGANYAMDKLFRSNPDFVGADGFEVLLSTGRTEIESSNEMKSIYSYLKMNRPLADIRWVVRMNSADQAETDGILKNMKSYPPTFVRVDPHVEDFGQSPKLAGFAQKVRDKLPFPIKVGGGITLAVAQELFADKNIRRFDVSFEQAETIIRALKIKANEVVPEQEKKLGPAVKKVGNVGRIRI